MNASREKSKELTDKLSSLLHEPKPRTYRKNARKDYLSIIKKKTKSKKAIQKGLKKQLGYLHRNISTIEKLLDEFEDLVLHVENYKNQYGYYPY